MLQAATHEQLLHICFAVLQAGDLDSMQLIVTHCAAKAHSTALAAMQAVLQTDTLVIAFMQQYVAATQQQQTAQATHAAASTVQ